MLPVAYYFSKNGIIITFCHNLKLYLLNLVVTLYKKCTVLNKIIQEVIRPKFPYKIKEFLIRLIIRSYIKP